VRLGIVGDREDLSAVYLAWRARERGAEVVELWEDGYGVDWRVEGRVSACCAGFRVERRGASLLLGDLAGLIVRLNPKPPVPARFGIEPAAEPIYALERRYGLQFVLDRLAGVPVVNRPSQGRANSSKPHQMLALAGSGFRVPAWCVTNERERADDFLRGCEAGAIYKACSGLRARVRRVGDELLARMSEGCCPALLQAYVPGVDVRVHVVGRRVFGSEVASEAVDYRFDELPIRYRPVEVPASLADGCLRHCGREGLLLAGLDFRRAPDGAWWCLEANPVPTFLPYEAGTGHAIGDAILDLLGPLPTAAPEVSLLWELSS
jgi:hypothetical protein